MTWQAKEKELADRFVFFYSGSHFRAPETAIYSQMNLKNFKVPCLDGKVFSAAEKYYQWCKVLCLVRHDGKIVTDVEQLTQNHPNHVSNILDFAAQRLNGDLKVINKDNIADLILKASPKQARSLSRVVEPSLEGQRAWDARVQDVVKTATLFKFQGIPEYRDKLLATGNKFIVEACPEDCPCECGAGVGPKSKGILRKRTQWKPNLLGKALMQTRELLRTYPHVNGILIDDLDSVEDGRGLTDEQILAIEV